MQVVTDAVKYFLKFKAISVYSDQIPVVKTGAEPIAVVLILPLP